MIAIPWRWHPSVLESVRNDCSQSGWSYWAVQTLQTLTAHWNCCAHCMGHLQWKRKSNQNNWKLDLIGTHLWKISWKLCTAFHVLFPKWVQMSYLRYQTNWNLRMDKATWVLYQQRFLILNSGHEKRQIVPNKTFSWALGNQRHTCDFDAKKYCFI